MRRGRKHRRTAAPSSWTESTGPEEATRGRLKTSHPTLRFPEVMQKPPGPPPAPKPILHMAQSSHEKQSRDSAAKNLPPSSTAGTAPNCKLFYSLLNECYNIIYIAFFQFFFVVVDIFCVGVWFKKKEGSCPPSLCPSWALLGSFIHGLKDEMATYSALFRYYSVC